MKEILAFVVWMCLAFRPTQAADVHFYVSPAGNDSNTGTSDKFPFQTLAKALSTASGPTYRNNKTYIDLMAGYHELQSTLYIMRPDLVIRSYKHQEVHLVGGKQIPSASFKPVTDAGDRAKLQASARQHVKIVELPSVGITNYGSLAQYGSYRRRDAELEISYNGQALQLPMWPKTGFLDIVSIPDVNGLKFFYNSTETRSWHTETDPWIYGFLQYTWSDRSVKVTSLDTQKQSVTIKSHVTEKLTEGHWNESHITNLGNGGYFKFVNILSALSQPGEYYVDRTNGKLYLWPPTKDSNVHTNDVVLASLVNSCIYMDHRAPNVKLQDFTIESCRRSGVFTSGSRGTQLINLEIKNTGADAIFCSGDNRDILVSKCVVHDSDGGININGGNRTTLESSGNIVENNEIYRYTRHGAVGYPGINVNGVGHTVRYNNIHSAKSTAIFYTGNDIVMEHNLVHHICEDKYYCDCIISVRDLTMRGNVFRSNIIHDVLGMNHSESHALRLDDHSSGTAVTNNVFYNNGIHVVISGGRDNLISGNLFYDAKVISVRLEGRYTLSTTNTNLLHAVPYTNNVWRLRYPKLAEIDQHNPAFPEGNELPKNIVFNKEGAKYFHVNRNEFNKPDYFNITNIGVSNGPSDHNDVSVGDYRIRCDLGKWADAQNVPQFPSPNEVGPKYEPGPAYLHRRRRHLVTLHNNHAPCTTMAPAKDTPMPAFVPDGTGTHVHFNVTKEGCWLSVPKCGNHTAAVGTYRDMYGERYHHASESEEMCFQRASEQWRYCGSNPRETVAAIYGPTGATSYGGKDCTVARYGCPKHGGPSDGHAYGYVNGSMVPDYSAINSRNANNNESACLARAVDIWVWCGSSRNHPVTMIFKPTGATRTAGAGCWIKMLKCTKHPATKPVFYDAWGATNRLTDDIEETCFDQAKYYWDWCGYDPKYPVTATYRPTTKSFTYP